MHSSTIHAGPGAPGAPGVPDRWDGGPQRNSDEYTRSYNGGGGSNDGIRRYSRNYLQVGPVDLLHVPVKGGHGMASNMVA